MIGNFSEWGGADRKRDVSGAVTGVLVRYVRALVGESGVQSLLAKAGEFRTPERLEAADTFSSHDQARNLFDAAAEVTGDSEIGLHVGEEMVRQYQGTEVEVQFRALGSPQVMVGNVAETVSRVTTMARSQTVDIGDDHAIVKVTSRADPGRNSHFCKLTRGMLSQATVPYGRGPATITEPECQASGGRFCLYSLTWEPGDTQPSETEPAEAQPGEAQPVEAQPGEWARLGSGDIGDLQIDSETRIAQLAGQLRQMGERLEGLFSTASEILGEEGIDTLLTRITSRAARTVSASRYLLVVRTSPRADIQLHHHGFDTDEAQELANELWKERPDDDGGARLIVDVASSRRRYGRLAAVYPPGVKFFESERRMLTMYAGFAASALDVFSSLETARRSDATARALLGFSKALSRATTTDATAQLLADAVPAVVGCQHGIVMLWSPEHRVLSVRAVTAGYPLASEPVGIGFIEQNETSTDEEPSDGQTASAETASADLMIDHIIGTRALVVIDQSSSQTPLGKLVLREGTNVSVAAPLFAGDEFLGMVAANFTDDTAGDVVPGTPLHERLAGLADHAVTAFQNVRLLERISHVAWHDTLTGLPNRRLLEDRVDQEIVRGRRVGESASLFFIDLDRFKAVNDSLGHTVGDELIRQVASRLVDTFRRQDTVARLGGDEFAVLLPGLSEPDDVEQLAKRCLAALSSAYDIFGRQVNCSASIGIALTPRHGQSYGELLTKADEAMYRSKANGRNTFSVSSTGEGA